MTVHLPEPIEHSVNEAVRSGRFPSADDALAAAWVAFTSAGQVQPVASQEPLTQTFKPIWEEIQELTADIPDEEFLKLPVDGAVQHDHYIYGLPKRPTS
jgi:Arc/MetJ-type ribon-helix-helix transcriptional regulator